MRALARRSTHWFQSTRPRGARHDLRRRFRKLCAFQSTRPRGARPLANDRVQSFGVCFNPRARAGRDGRVCRIVRDSSQCFNPRARAGRDERFSAGGRLSAYHVSIHAPARGATLDFAIRSAPADMFQSTRPRGARQPLAHADAARCSFNPRARAGRDGRHAAVNRAGRCFNPRARAGRDACQCVRLVRRRGFNPRARAGRDVTSAGLHAIAVTMFQSTRPRGARPAIAWRRITVQIGFNPRARAGRDDQCRTSTSADRSVSIHAPARGATVSDRAGMLGCSTVSIHAPARGATYAARRVADRELFQSTRPRGARRRRIARYVSHRVSIHAPARGATVSRRRTPAMSSSFQSTRPRGARPAARIGSTCAVRVVSIHAPARGATVPLTRRLAR